jgi:hypothetical protein
MLAQLPASTPEQLGNWMVPAIGMLAATWLIRQIWVSFFPSQPAEQFATRRDLEKAVDELEERIEKMAEGNRREHEHLAEKTGRSISELHQAINALGIKLENINGQMAKDIAVVRSILQREVHDHHERREE